jgi:hypothetical protein
MAQTKNGSAITWTGQRTDDRRNRHYWLDLTARIDLQTEEPVSPGVNGFGQYDMPATDATLKAKLPGALHSYLSALSGGIDTHTTWNRGSDRVFTSVGFVFRLVADKPSEIPSVDEVRDILQNALNLSDAGTLTEVLQTAVTDWLDVRDAVRERMTRAAQARHAARHFAGNADGLARDIVRFKQRLAALVAELAAEQDVQLAKGLDADLDEASLEGELLDDRVKAAVLAHASKFMPTARPGGLHGISSASDLIKLEDVD